MHYLFTPLQDNFFLHQIIVIEGLQDMCCFGQQLCWEGFANKHLKCTKEKFLGLAILIDKLEKKTRMLYFAPTNDLHNFQIIQYPNIFDIHTLKNSTRFFLIWDRMFLSNNNSARANTALSLTSSLSASATISLAELSMEPETFLA